MFRGLSGRLVDGSHGELLHWATSSNKETVATRDVSTPPQDISGRPREGETSRNVRKMDHRRATSYLGGESVDPIVAQSALKHGLGEEEILHTYRNPIRVWDLGDGFTMIVGAGSAAAVIEVGVVQGDDGVVIVHAMRAREKFLR